ncbi:MAG: hypothetical protein ACI9HK_006175, partial [Pirellulaceae bacterium]
MLEDEDLLQILLFTKPSELPPPHAEQLLERLPESVELRAGLREMDESRRLGLLERIGMSAERFDEICRAANNSSTSLGKIVAVAVVLLIVAIGTWWVATQRNNEVVDAGPNSTADSVNSPTGITPQVVDKGDAPERPGHGTDSDGETPGVPHPADASGDTTDSGNSSDPPNGGTATGVDEPVAEPPKPVDIASLPKFKDVCFGTFDVTKSLPNKEDVERWFEAKKGGKFSVTRSRWGEIVQFDGLVGFRKPLLEGKAIRLWLDQFNRLQIRLFNGEEGITLAYYEGDRHRWGAYKCSRDPQAEKPQSYELIATDDDQNRRSSLQRGGPIELRYYRGRLFLTRGDLVLINVPCDKAPDEIHLQGRAMFVGIDYYDSAPPIIPEIEAAKEFVYTPADLHWDRISPERQEFAKLPDGGVRLSSKNSPSMGWAATLLPDHGPAEIILELADVTEGTGVFLGHGNNQVHRVVQFITNTRDKRLTAHFGGFDSNYMMDKGSVDERIMAYVNREHVWVKLVFGC